MAESSASGYQPAAGVELDLGNLAAFDTRVGLTGTPAEVAAQGLQELVRGVFSLPAETTDDGRFVALPPGAFHLPREKAIPKERARTKWEQFALEKGIQKRKRDRLVLDDATGEYVPRYGRGSRNDLARDAVLPHKAGMPDDWNPFDERRAEKRKRVRDNRKKNVANVRRATKQRQAADAKAAASLAPVQALDVGKAGPSGKKFLPKSGLKDTLAIAQKSTASAGKFDRKVANEPKQKTQGRKKRYASDGGKKGMQQEKQRSQKIADRILLQGAAK